MRIQAILIFLCFNLYYLSAQLIISENENSAGGSFPIYTASKHADIFCDSNDYETVKIAVGLLASDIEMVTGHRPEIVHDKSAFSEFMIIAGSLEKCSIVKELSSSKEINSERLAGRWEQFCFKTVQKPFPGVKQALVICGSDKRGTAFGVFTLSKAMGVSPWYWWADVVPEKKSNLFVAPVEYLSPAPSVKYRGIFLNDEDWGLQPWAAKTFEPETGDIGPKTYAKIFELLLRMKANLIWPAMHPCTKAFYHYPGNRETADDYGIVVGSSHAEPMLRNNVDEWDVKTMGEFSYASNAGTIYNYWKQRAEQGKNYENIYTIGIRGIHDSGMEGVSSMEDKKNLLEKVFADQREIIKNHINQDVTKVPQAFIPYKEVLEIYDNELNLPDDITIVWPDDNYGYIRRLNTSNESKRLGGSGVYYHLSYWGRPHDYLWLGTTHPNLVREELYKAWQNGCSTIWVMNVGDIKPAEYLTQLSMDMAYQAEPFAESNYVKIHLHNWLQHVFGSKAGSSIQHIMWEYYQLAFERRPEFMGWSQTEPTMVINPTEYNHFSYNDEAQKRLDRYNRLSLMADSLKHTIPNHRSDAYYQLVYYPVRCATLMNRKFLHLEKAHNYAKQYRVSANDHALLAKQAFDSIMLETSYYNEKLAGGKWRYIMSMNPRSLPVFDCPMIPSWETAGKTDFGICLEGFTDERPRENMYGSRLPVFYTPEDKYFTDLFLTGNGNINWVASPSQPWITVNKNSGILKDEFLKKEERLWIGIDHTKLQDGKDRSGFVTIKGGTREFNVPVRLKVSGIANGTFIEKNGLVSIFGENYSHVESTSGYKQEVSDGLGYSGKALMLSAPMNTSMIDDSIEFKASAEYDFVCSSKGDVKVYVYCLPVHPLNSNHKLSIGLSIDNEAPKIVDYQTFDRNETWKQNVLRNSAIITSVHSITEPGKHSIKISAFDPGVIIDRILLLFGNNEAGYSAIPETRMK
ncbi:MAG: glycosyl hydrolase 115 family protein [Bacteroidales bacterium]|nr:glycosyl hydrolase 115 family protein [Bacteroidales bacterium]